MSSVLAVTVKVPSEQAQAGAMEREAQGEANSYVDHTAF